MRTAGKPAILIASGDWPPEPWAATIRAREPDRAVYCWPDLQTADGVQYLLAWAPPPEAVAAVPHIKAIFSLGAGVDHVMSGLTLPDVPIVRVISGDLTSRMTEWVTLQVLMHHRRQRAYDQAQAARHWEELPQPPAREVRVGVMGLGELGRAAATALAGLRFQVAGWSRRPHTVDGVASFHGKDGLDAFLARTDILVCLLPLTPATRGILSRPLFDKLASDGVHGRPFLINAGRGGLQNEPDIDRALTDGTLAGASLDVFEREPLAADSPLWAHKNLIITPHCSGPSTPQVLAGEIHDQILAFEAGRPLRGIVDRQAGY